jgi:AraC-like DNA-binding protein
MDPQRDLLEIVAAGAFEPATNRSKGLDPPHLVVSDEHCPAALHFYSFFEPRFAVSRYSATRKLNADCQVLNKSAKPCPAENGKGIAWTSVHKTLRSPVFSRAIRKRHPRRRPPAYSVSWVFGLFRAGKGAIMKTMHSPPAGETRFWRPDHLGGAELIFASYGRYAFPRHFHEEYLIANMVGGAERLQHSHGTDEAPAGSLILLNPGQVHENSAVDDSGFAYRTLYVPIGLAEQCLIDAGLPATPLPGFTQTVAWDRETFAVLQQLHLAVEAGEPALRLQTLLGVGICRIFRRHGAVPLLSAWPRPSSRTITQVREYLDAHFAENVSLADLSRLVGLSAFHLARSFREAVGLPPCQYQINRRILYVVGRLRDGAPIASAACEAGFADQSHLNRHFKRIVGITPGQFRANRKSVQDMPRG